MKFRSSILSLAAVSALTATAFMVTGCGSSSSSTGTSTTPTTSGTSTGVIVKGMWAGIPYNLTSNETGATTEYKTAASGMFNFNKGYNVTFKPGMGVKANFEDLNATGTMSANATRIMYSADQFTQGSSTLSAAAAREAAYVLSTIYQQLGVNENGTGADGVTPADADLVSKIQAAIEDAYTAEPGKFALDTVAKANSFSTVYKDLLVNYVGPKSITAANGSAITATIADGLVTGYADNKTDVETEMQKIVDEASASATFNNAPAPADLVNAYVVATQSNNTLAEVVGFGSEAKSYFVNGSILQTAATGGETMAFLDADYTEGSKVSNGTDTLTYRSTLVPFDLVSNVTAGTGNQFNLTVDGKTFQFHTHSTNDSVGYYNLSNRGGLWYMANPSGSTAGQKLIVLGNSTEHIKGDATEIGAMVTAVNSTLASGGANDTVGVRTIGFKTNVDPDGRPFIAYYWDKVVKVYNDWAAGPSVGDFIGYGAEAWGSANATFNGATVDKEATFSSKQSHKIYKVPWGFVITFLPPL
eukprot:TRINITY_DN124438_c0_g1_i1.p2 TRINITY_DN124438_c0_g1~~TRINITY_DN124438_c0_g1_i1.p2  ORF type:complete len:563 (-),score=-8.36 TRINITY_DN124438_c0_g1_i1:493-2082(-)